MQRRRREPMEQALQTKLTIIDHKEESKTEGSQENGGGHDDLIMTGSSPQMIKSFKEAMTKAFYMTDMGLMSYFLGFEVKQGVDGIFMTKEQYAKEVLKRFRMDDCNPVNTPVDCGTKLSKSDEGKTVDPTCFKSLVGSLRYLTCTRPNILYGVGLVSRFMEEPKETHWKAAKRILHYVRGDTMIENSSLINGQTLTSTGDIFQLGFFRLDGNSSAKGYLGIWYCNFTPQEGIVVWIANRNMSVSTSMASFNFTSDGNLILFEEDKIVWSTGTRSTELNSARLQLLDSGNLVLNDNNSILWQSFEDSNDSATYLPGMKLGFDNRTNTSWREVSWKTPTDPSPGDYIQMIRDLPIPDLVFFNGSAKYHRGGLWNGNWFVGHPLMASSQLANSINVTFVSNENESYIMNNYTASPTPVLTRSVMWANGTFQRWSLDSGGKREWQLLWSIPADECDTYNHCGRNRVCTNKYFAVECQCLDGFVNITENGREAGCERKKPLNCSSNQFSKVQNVKVPDTENATPRGNMSLDDCKNLCLNDCSCVAYAVISGSYGCITWLGDLLDLRTFVDEGDDLYVRLTGR
ncbi:hypothetical protein ZIOFF_025186 [Zingiber officinale]|uniref:Uncharacterized protein n=1 Tax=Zingiber officinale TaxID=94328 RepID=A0A8J5H0F4_ZINOF|nr:hypothetical protein ZIOFF_025186 [Zingiber officinale]